MPLYTNQRNTETRLGLGMDELFAQLVMNLRGQSYGDRGYGFQDKLTFEAEDINHDLIVVWAMIRDEMLPIQAHILAEHTEETAVGVLAGPHSHASLGRTEENDDQSDGKHGHLVPPLSVLADKWARQQEQGESVGTTQEGYDATRAELEGLVGFQVVATNSHATELEDVFK